MTICIDPVAFSQSSDDEWLWKCTAMVSELTIRSAQLTNVIASPTPPLFPLCDCGVPRRTLGWRHKLRISLLALVRGLCCANLKTPRGGSIAPSVICGRKDKDKQSVPRSRFPLIRNGAGLEWGGSLIYGQGKTQRKRRSIQPGTISPSGSGCEWL